MSISDKLAAQIEPFDSFWEGPEDVQKGYSKFYAFYKDNYAEHLPDDKTARILVVSCGPGYFVHLLQKLGYSNVHGIDSFADKIEWAQRNNLPCEQARAFEHLDGQPDDSFDVIFCEQELNHLTKEEILRWLKLCFQKLKPGGRIICHALNGANPITGAEALAQNFDHYNSFTEYTMRQVLEHSGFRDTQVYPLNLYVFWKNPANYLLLAFVAVLHGLFRLLYIIYGKSNKLFTKKIGAVALKP